MKKLAQIATIIFLAQNVFANKTKTQPAAQVQQAKPKTKAEIAKLEDQVFKLIQQHHQEKLKQQIKFWTDSTNMQIKAAKDLSDLRKSLDPSATPEQTKKIQSQISDAQAASTLKLKTASDAFWAKSKSDDDALQEKTKKLYSDFFDPKK